MTKKKIRNQSDRPTVPDDADSTPDDARSRRPRRRDRLTPDREKVRLSWRKKLAFAAVATLLALLLVEAGLWLFGVRPVIATEDPYVGFSSLSPLFVETLDEDETIWMETAENKRKWFNGQKFAPDKPDGTYRIFCLGGSTTFGRPYDDATSFCGFLRKYLPAADSSHPWEVINCGGISYASYREAIIVKEACRYEPDLFIFYGSQNEFLERRTYRTVIETPPMVRGLGALASRTRVYAAAHWAVQAARGEPDDTERDVLDDDVLARLDRSVGPTDYVRDDEQRQRIVEHYRYNLSKMIDTARANGADVLLVQPASNLRDCSPFKSQHSDDVASDDEKLAAYERAYRDAKTKMDAAEKLAAAVDAANLEDDSKAKTPPKSDKPSDSKATTKAEEDGKNDGDAKIAAAKNDDGKSDEKTSTKKSNGGKPLSDAEKGRWAIFNELKQALDAIDRAIAIDPRYAAGHYRRGQILDRLRYFADAKAAYQRALEEDVCPLRAIREIDDVTKLVANDRKADVIDFPKIVADVSPQGIADKEWFMDHVHPSPAGHKILAQAIVDQMIENGVVRDTGAWTAEAKNRIGDTIISRIGARRHGEAMRTMSKVFEWAGKPEEANHWARQAIKFVPNDAEALFRAAAGAEKQGQFDTAIALYQRSLEINPTVAVTYNSLGNINERAGEYGKALEYYRTAEKYASLRGEKDFVLQSRTLAAGALMKLNRLDEAEKELRDVVATDANLAEAHNQLGKLYALKDDAETSLAMFAAARRLEPRNASFARNEGAMLARAGKHADAKRVLGEALSIEPGNAQAHATLADVHLGLREYDDAAEAYRKALRIEPDFDAARGNLAEILMQQWQLDEADRLLSAGPSGREVMGAMARLAWRLATTPEDEFRNGKRAVELAQRVRKTVGDKWARGLDVLAAAYAETGQFDAAVTTANLAVAAAVEAKDDDLATAVKQRLEGYRQNKPHRDPALVRLDEPPK